MKPVDALHNGGLGLIVKCRGCFVQNQHLRILEKRAGDADSLLLSAGKADAVLSDSGIQPFRKRAHMLVQLRLLQCSPDLLIINILIRDTEGHIFPDGCIQHIN